MKFINREQELARLEKEYSRDGFSFVVIYGRRRVGKTRLIKEFIHDKNSLYFLADTQSEKLNRQRLQALASEQFEDEFLSEIQFKDWEKLIAYITRQGTEKTKKLAWFNFKCFWVTHWALFKGKSHKTTTMSLL